LRHANQGLRTGIPVEGIVAIVTAGVGVIQVNAVGPPMALQAYLLSSLVFFKVGRSEVFVVALVGVQLWSHRRLERDLLSVVMGIGHVVGIVTGNAGDIFLGLGKDPLLSPFRRFQKMPLVGRVTTEAQGIVRVELRPDHMEVAIPGLHQIVGGMMVVLRQDPSHRRVALAAGAGRSVHQDILCIKGLRVTSTRTVARLAADVMLHPAARYSGIFWMGRPRAEAGKMTRTAFGHLLLRKPVPMPGPVVKTGV
jgi:hypothetical protein